MLIDKIFSKSTVWQKAGKTSKEPQTTSPIQQDEGRYLEGSLDALAACSAAKISTHKTIPPKEFNSVHSYEDFKPAVKAGTKPKYIFIQKDSKLDESKFKDSLNPITLDTCDKVTETYDISNFASPGGTIAISTKINGKPISTSGLLQCSGISFVDKNKGIQTLLHLCPTINKKDNDDLIHYILSHSKPEDLEITIVPGCYHETDNTIAYFMDTIGEYKDKSKITFANFPDGKHDTLILQNGELSCSDGLNLYGEINPKGKLIHAGRK